jgi:hypothetical protein
MTHAEYIAEQGPKLLDALTAHRQKILDQLMQPDAVGNLEDEWADKLINRLGLVQGCIQAAREAVGDVNLERTGQWRRQFSG